MQEIVSIVITNLLLTVNLLQLLMLNLAPTVIDNNNNNNDDDNEKIQ